MVWVEVGRRGEGEGIGAGHNNGKAVGHRVRRSES